VQEPQLGRIVAVDDRDREHEAGRNAERAQDGRLQDRRRRAVTMDSPPRALCWSNTARSRRLTAGTPPSNTTSYAAK
jgi:hypothetical protein